MTEYADPDLETVAPLPPLPPLSPTPVAEPARRGGPGPIRAFVTSLAIVSLVVGFGTATIVLNARDSEPKPVAGAPAPATTTTAPPAANGSDVLGGLIVQQGDVPAGFKVGLLANGAGLTIATLDLCNGTFPSESQRTARRQVALSDAQGRAYFSTEAILYRDPSGGAQAIREIRSVAATCPSTPVRSPVGDGIATTKFRAAPDGAWPRTPSVERLAYDFDTIDAADGSASHSVVVYLRRGRVLMGLYFVQPDGPQVAVDGRTSIAGIVEVFEARMAKVPARVAGG